MSERTDVPSGTTRTLSLLETKGNKLGFFCDGNDRTETGPPRSLFINDPSKTGWPNYKFPSEWAAASVRASHPAGASSDDVDKGLEQSNTTHEISTAREVSLTELKLQEPANYESVVRLVRELNATERPLDSRVTGPSHYAVDSAGAGSGYLTAQWGEHPICFRYPADGMFPMGTVLGLLEGMSFGSGAITSPTDTGHWDDRSEADETLIYHLQHGLQVYMPVERDIAKSAAAINTAENPTKSTSRDTRGDSGGTKDHPPAGDVPPVP